ncbi:hypothetical protein H696_00880 [Fonticula alba]|uniref:Uncharacterized protein n=1 Tax=Fonticula alba TaxID=691883 RepID=A0A058ZHA1_FONAL|nr:hypothetical protein H696_00880 [Fonticula alba]KCV73341.1 hypothetical protein H696_00880 [Fonticula alba]|eukprot:XP_009493042.1 hypothetical protein H696_00880 [Fonticula alba]
MHTVAAGETRARAHLRVRRELGDGLGTLRDGVLGELTGEDEADGGLDLTRRDGGALGEGGQLGGLIGNALEDVVDEGVHDGHGIGTDAGLGVDLLQDTVDVGGVGLLAAGAALALAIGTTGGLGGDLGGGLAGGLLVSALVVGGGDGGRDGGHG